MMIGRKTSMMSDYNLNMLSILYMLLMAAIPVWTIAGICKLFGFSITNAFAMLIMGDEYEPF